MRVRKKKRLVLLFATGLTLGGLALSMGNTYVAFADSNGPQTITTNNAQKTWVSASDGKLHAQYDGQWVAGNGYHRVNIIKQKGKSGRDSYIFCINFSKESPSNTQMVKKVQANPAVQWLITDFSKGHDKSFESIDGAGADYDLADYWLYQTAVHLVACPNERSPYDGNTTGDSVKNFSPAIRDKVYRLVNEAKKHQNESDSEIVLNSAKLEFDPSSLNISSSDLHSDKYEKGFTTKSNNMHDIQVHAEQSQYEKYLTGTRKNGSKADLQNVNDGDNLKVAIPYKDVGNDGFSFKVKATGHWNKRAKVAWIYGTNDSKIQDVAKLGIKATTVPMNADTLMTVNVKPSFGSLTFVKRGSGNNNTKILPGTEFSLTADGFSQTQTADGNGRVTFNNLPLGKKYHLKEIKQPDGQYNASYERDIDQLTGDNPQRQVDLGTIVNDKKHQPFEITKKNISGAGIEGAQFVLIRKDLGEPFNQISVEDAKKQALRQVNGELVTGHSDQQPYIATTDKDGHARFDKVLLDSTRHDYYDYYAVEIKSPNGYALGTIPVKLPNVGPTAPDVVTGEMTDNTQPIPTTGSKYLLIEATAAITITCAVGGYALYESKKNKER